MVEREVSLSQAKWIVSILGILVLTVISVLIDIPVLRQLSGFIYVAFVPGLLLLYIFKLHQVSLTVKILLSVGLSASFFLIFGLAFNAVSLAVGFEKPLATVPLLIAFGAITMILLVIAFFRNRTNPLTFTPPSFSIRDKLVLIIPALFPLLAVVGTRFMNMSDNNALLITLFTLIIAYVIFLAFYHRHISESVFPVVIFLISISLLLIYLVRNTHITGADVHAEYYLFRLTSEANHWEIWAREILDSCLVVSMLPALYQSIIQTNPEYLYRIMYTFFFSMSPLAVYVISRKYIGAYPALLASFFFMSQLIFVQNTGDARNWIASFFFTLVIMVIIDGQISIILKKSLFLIFSTCIVLSHYSTSYIFAIFLIGVWIIVKLLDIFRKRMKSAGGQSDSFTKKDKQLIRHHPPWITLGMIFSIIVIVFLWYSQLTGESFSYGVRFIGDTFERLHSFFIMESRTSLVSSALGNTIVDDPSRIPKIIELVFSWLTIVLIATGVLAIIGRRLPALLSFFKAKKFFNNLEENFDYEYLAFILVACSMILITVLVPYISQGYDLMRVYFMMMVILAPLFVVGGMVLTRLIRIRWVFLLVLVALVPYFLSTTGITYQVLGAPKVANLSSQSLGYDLYYVHEQDVAAAKWLGNNFPEGSKIYSFGQGQYILMSQGGLLRNEAGGDLYRAYLASLEINGYIFLIFPNVVKDKVAIPGYTFIGIDEYRELIDSRNKLYATNGSEVYR